MDFDLQSKFENQIKILNQDNKKLLEELNNEIQACNKLKF